MNESYVYTAYIYYLTYFVISGIQFIFAWRNVIILIIADKLGSSAMFATVLVLLINGLDIFFIFHVLRGIHIIQETHIIAHFFWFGIRNVCLFWYWAKVLYYLYLTKERCACSS